LIEVNKYLYRRELTTHSPQLHVSVSSDDYSCVRCWKVIRVSSLDSMSLCLNLSLGLCKATRCACILVFLQLCSKLSSFLGWCHVHRFALVIPFNIFIQEPNCFICTGNTPEAVDTARNKHAARACMEAAGLPTPLNYLIKSDDQLSAAAAHVGFPAVIKPISGAASIGVIRVNDEEQLKVSYARCCSSATSSCEANPGQLCLVRSAETPNQRCIVTGIDAPYQRCLSEAWKQPSMSCFPCLQAQFVSCFRVIW
jgi:hypothetical protein